MARLSHTDVGQADEVVAAATTVRLDAPAGVLDLLARVGELVRADVPALYGVRIDGGATKVEFLTCRRAGSRSGDPAARLAELEAMHQLKVSLGGERGVEVWLAAFRSAPFGARERQLLARVAPAVRERLAFERQLEIAPLARAALDAALGALERPAFVADIRGRVHRANRQARALVDREGSDLAALVRAAIAGDPVELQVKSISGDDGYYLALGPEERNDTELRAERLGQRWALTPREAQTLLCLVKGASNRAIAAELGCAERTVEVHVGRLLRKSDSENRSELIAKFWGEP